MKKLAILILTLVVFTSCSSDPDLLTTLNTDGHLIKVGIDNYETVEVSVGDTLVVERRGQDYQLYSFGRLPRNNNHNYQYVIVQESFSNKIENIFWTYILYVVLGIIVIRWLLF